MNFSEIILELLKRPEAHARFVNTLSMLEYIGARKILKSQEAESISMQILGHAAEEIRHAQILKGFALQLSDGKLSGYSEAQLLCGNAARAYFQAIDNACADFMPVKDAKRNYALTTLLIEERAMKIYPEYEILLRERGIPNALRSIIKDEDKHLSEMQEELRDETNPGNDLRMLRAFEEKSFATFLKAVFEEIIGERRKLDIYQEEIPG